MNREFLDVLRCSDANQRQGNVQKKCAAIRPIVVFQNSGQGHVHPTTVFCKISVREANFA